MAKIPARMRGALDRKVEKLSRTGKLKGKNLDRVMARMDRLRKPSAPKTPAPPPYKTRQTANPKPKPTKHDEALLRQGFTRKELGL